MRTRVELLCRSELVTGCVLGATVHCRPPASQATNRITFHIKWSILKIRYCLRGVQCCVPNSPWLVIKQCAVHFLKHQSTVVVQYYPIWNKIEQEQREKLKSLLWNFNEIFWMEFYCWNWNPRKLIGKWYPKVRWRHSEMDFKQTFALCWRFPKVSEVCFLSSEQQLNCTSFGRNIAV